MSGYKAAGTTVNVIAIDPGSTTGIAVITIDGRWIRGLGDATYDGLGRAIRSKVAYQIGRYPKAMYGDAVETLSNVEMDERMLPVYAEKPDADGITHTMRDERFRAVMSGDQQNGGTLMSGDAGEVVQLRQIAGLMENYSTAAIVIEDFNLRTAVRSREVTSPDRLRLAITAIELLYGTESRTPFLQQPAYAKTTATDERLKRAGLWFPGMPHACDAARHALTFLRDARQHEQIRAFAWPHKFTDGFGDD
ncbi:MAG: hypothetical protein ACM3UO_00365 [Bacillota bacterium]